MSAVPACDVIAVVVTYNRQQLLLKCLASLYSQSVLPRRVILIDNASTDETQAVVRASRYSQHPLLRYERMATNTGGAGGFHEGMRLALEEGAQWIWVMDDDVAAEPDALEKLLGYTALSECIHPSRTLPDGSPFEWEQIFDPSTTAKLPLRDISFRNGMDFCVMRIACFEGMLISASLVRKIGLPRREFFIGDDDTLYGFTASLHTNVLYVRSARLRKLIAPSSGITSTKTYYAVRNKLWMHKAIRDLGVLKGAGRLRFFPYYVSYVCRLVLGNFSLATVRAAYRGILDGTAAPRI